MNRANRFLCSGSPHVTGTFGDLISVHRKPHVAGHGHVEHVCVCCEGGLEIQITQAFAITLTRRLLEQLRLLPELPADCGGNVWGGDE